MRKVATFGVPLFALIAGTGWAQDFGREWMDRVTNQLEQERAPLRDQPLDVRFFAGERVYYDNNVYLENKDEDGDTVFVTFGNVRLDYAEESFDAALDLQANYNYYVHEDDASDDEERLYGRARWAGSQVQVEVAEIFRRESDPFIDPQIVERAERIVSDTMPRVTVWATDVLSFEASGTLQVVRFSDDIFEAGNNINYRVGLLGAYELPSGVQILLDGGYLLIDYDNDPTDTVNPGPPDAEGGYVRGGFRGDMQQRIYLSVLAGVTRGASEKVDDLNIESQRHTTGDIEMHLRFEASEKATMFFDYTRRVAFGAGESFEIINRVRAGIEYAASAKLKVIGRGQYDYAHGISGFQRDYGSVSVGANYTLFENLILDAGATYRQGGVKRGGDIDFTDVIVSAGAAVTF